MANHCKSVFHSPICLLMLLPSSKQESFYGCQLASLNGLAVEARCAIKARQVVALGPPVNLLVKVRAFARNCGMQAGQAWAAGVPFLTSDCLFAAGALSSDCRSAAC